MIAEGSHVRVVDERGSALRGDVGVVIGVHPDRGSAMVLFEADPAPMEVMLGFLRLAGEQEADHRPREVAPVEHTPETKEFLNQLRGALRGMGDDALAQGREAAEEHARQVRGVATALGRMGSTSGALVREDLHPSLATETGRWLLTVCGFEAAPPEYQALHEVPVYRLPPSDVTCRMLVPVVSAHLDQYDPAAAAPPPPPSRGGEQAHPDEAAEFSPPPRRPTEGAGAGAAAAAGDGGGDPQGRARALLCGALRSGALAAALQALRESEALGVLSRYRADNSKLEAGTDGLQFRGSKDVGDRIARQLMWGETVMGVDEGDGWLKVGDAYLPLSAHDCPVLVPDGQEPTRDAADGGAAGGQQSAQDQGQAPAIAAEKASEALFDGAELLPPGPLFSEMSDVVVTLDGLDCVRHLKVRDSSAILSIAEDSVVKCTAGAIVNAANEACLGGSGIDGVIGRLGGDALAAARKALPILAPDVRCYTGDAKLTTAGELPCEFVIHAVGPDFHCYSDQTKAMTLLANAYKSSMERAREHGIKKVAFCMLSAGIFRGACPLRDIIEVGLMTVAQHVYSGLERVYLCAFSDKEKEQLRDICSALRQGAAGGSQLDQDAALASVMQKSFEEAADGGQLDQDAALASAMQQSFEEEEAAHRRPGMGLSPSLLAELGATFEPQPDGSDTCAIHSLNNIVQIPRPADDSHGSSSSPPPAERGPFGLKDLQRAEAKAEKEALAEGFLPQPFRTPSSRSLQRAASASTGMFDVETVKVAARAKGYEVIDVEPVPGWSGSDAERFVEASAKAATYRSDRWFLGFLVYERIPGKAMHYYVIRRWPSKAPGEHGPWLVLDSLDRGTAASRNRLLSQDELVSFYNSNGTWFRRWLVRWYPVVDRAAAVATLRNEVGSKIQQVCGHIPEAFGHLGISERRAESTLEGGGVGWDLSLALEELLGAAELIDREVHVLRLAVSERQARQRLEAAEWDLERAVREQAERLLGGCLGEAPGAKPSERVLYAALHMADWSAKGAARILLLHARAEEAVARDAASESAEGKLGEQAPVIPGSPMACSAEVSTEALQSAATALEECSWDMDKALEVLRLLGKELRAERRRKEEEDYDEAGSTKALTETECAQVLTCVGFDTQRAAQMLGVSRSYPTAPLPVCAEALRRADSCVVSARALLEEFVSRVSEVVSQAAQSVSKGKKRSLGPEEAAEVARWTLQETEWNPAIAFPSAESFAVLLLQTFIELSEERKRARLWANDTVNTVCGQGPAAAATEEEMAAALEALDKMNAAEGQLTVAAVLEGLKQADMRPDLAAAALWQKTTGLPTRPLRPGGGAAEAAPAASAPAAAAAPAPARRPETAPVTRRGSAGGAQAGKAPAQGRRGKPKEKEECVVS